MSERRTKLGSEKLNQLLFIEKNLSLLKELENVETTKMKRPISTSISRNTEQPDDDLDDELSVETKLKKQRSDSEQNSFFDDRQFDDD